MAVENIEEAHSDRAGKSALPAAHKQSRKHYNKVSEVYVHISKRNKKHRKRNVAQRRKKRYKGYVEYFLMCCFFHFVFPIL